MPHRETLDDPQEGFDLIFLADLLWLTPSLKALAKSCSETLVKTKEARVCQSPVSSSAPSSHPPTPPTLPSWLSSVVDSSLWPRYARKLL